MVLDACNPMVCLIHVFNRTAMGGCYGWLLWVVADGACNPMVCLIHVFRRNDLVAFNWREYIWAEVAEVQCL